MTKSDENGIFGVSKMAKSGENGIFGVPKMAKMTTIIVQLIYGTF